MGIFCVSANRPYRLRYSRRAARGWFSPTDTWAVLGCVPGPPCSGTRLHGGPICLSLGGNIGVRMTDLTLHEQIDAATSYQDQLVPAGGAGTIARS